MSIPKEWVKLINDGIVKGKEASVELPDLVVEGNAIRMELKAMKVKHIYKVMTENEIKTPASEKYWGEYFRT